MFRYLRTCLSITSKHLPRISRFSIRFACSDRPDPDVRASTQSDTGRAYHRPLWASSYAFSRASEERSLLRSHVLTRSWPWITRRTQGVASHHREARRPASPQLRDARHMAAGRRICDRDSICERDSDMYVGTLAPRNSTPPPPCSSSLFPPPQLRPTYPLSIGTTIHQGTFVSSALYAEPR